MATLRADDGVNLYDEDTGSGTPIVFVHQYVGDPTLEPGLFMKRNIKSAELRGARSSIPALQSTGGGLPSSAKAGARES